MKARHIFIILFLGVILLAFGFKCWEPWKVKKTSSGSSYILPNPIIPGTWAWSGTDWTLLKPATANGCPVGGDFAMVYDSARDRVVVFGGSTNDPNNVGTWINLDDTWEFDGTNWIQCYGTITPSARSWHAMAYDPVRAKTVLFGGWEPGQPDDTWEWDGTNWVEKFPVNKPPARDAQGMAYDMVTNKIILFGGYSVYSKTALADTWEWDGTNWTQLFPPNTPPKRHLFGMVCDTMRQKIVLFGGYRNPPTLDLNDTWEWDGTDWTEITTTNKPMERFGHGMAYDSFRQRVVMYGGLDLTWEPAAYTPGWNYNILPTWEYDGVNWTPLFPKTYPGKRSPTVQMVYDSIRKRVIMFP